MRARRNVALQAEHVRPLKDEHEREGDEGGDRGDAAAGILLYLLSTLFGASTSIIVKLLGGSGGMPAMQLVFVRSCVLVLCSAPVLRMPAARQLIAEHHDLLAVRGALGFVSVASIYAAVRLLPLSDAVALAFLAPLLVAALSPLLLHERPPRGVMFPLALAACGALLVARPASLGGLLPAGVVPDDGAGVAGAGGDAALASSRAGVVAALAHALSTAAAKIAVRSLALAGGPPASRAVTGTIVLSAGSVSAVGAGAVLLATGGWVAPATPTQWVLLAAVGLVGFLHQLSMTAALQRVPVSTTSSLMYFSILWAIAADTLIFRHLPARSTLLGAALICAGGGLLALWRARSGFDAAAAQAAASQAASARLPQKEQLLHT